MVRKSTFAAWKIAAPATLMALGFGAAGCDRTTVNEAAGNTQTYMDVTATKEVTGQDMSINRIRVVKSTATDNAPGVASIRDDYYLDVWATLSGETKQRKNRLGPFQADADGNLYVEGNAPGTIFYNTAITAAVGTDVTYEVTAKDGLIATEWDKVVETTTTLSESGARAITKSVLIQPSVQDASLSNIRARTYATGALFSRTRFQENKDFSLKGKLGCFNKTTAANADTSYAEKQTWYDVELGTTLSDKDGTTANTKTATDDSSAGDQILWVNWTENWYVTGINVNTKVVRIVRERSAPFYTNRELPQRVKTTAASGSSNISGVEKMIRACSNDVKVTTGSKSFQTSGFTTVSGTTYTAFSRLTGTGASHCAGTVDPVATTVALTTGFTGGATVFTGCTTLTNATFGFTIGAGTWDGTKSGAALTSVTSSGTFTHLDHSAVVELTF